MGFASRTSEVFRLSASAVLPAVFILGIFGSRSSRRHRDRVPASPEGHRSHSRLLTYAY
jgi:hypothetical protein